MFKSEKRFEIEKTCLMKKSNVSYDAIKKNKTLMGFDEEIVEAE